MPTLTAPVWTTDSTSASAAAEMRRSICDSLLSDDRNAIVIENIDHIGCHIAGIGSGCDPALRLTHARDAFLLQIGGSAPCRPSLRDHAQRRVDNGRVHRIEAGAIGHRKRPGRPLPGRGAPRIEPDELALLIIDAVIRSID